MEDQALAKGQMRSVRWIGGQKIVLDREGFLANPSLWSDEVALVLAGEAGLASLTDRHWHVLRFIRKYYTEQGKAPQNHKLKVGTGMKLSEIESLFPGGITKGAHRFAGLPRRKGCSAG